MHRSGVALEKKFHAPESIGFEKKVPCTGSGWFLKCTENGGAPEPECALAGLASN